MESQLQIGYPKMYTAIYALLCFAAIVAVFFYMDLGIFWLVLIILTCSVMDILSFSLDFDREELCITRFLIFHRHITSDRICSIQPVAINSAPILIICIDGHRPYNDFCEFNWFFFSFKVIRMQLPFSREKREEYVAGLQALYGDKVIVEKSYQKCFEKK